MAESVPVVLPCRFAGGGLSMQTTTSRVSAEGVFVRCLVSPKEGSPIELWLTLPGLKKPLEARGVLTERVNPGAQEAGFFVRFGALSPEARSAIDTLLRGKGVAVQRQPAAAAPRPAAPRPAAPPAVPPAVPIAERRTWQRIPTRFLVRWASPKEFLVAYSDNISRGGIFVATPAPPALREIVELLLELPDGKGPVKTQAEVVQRVTAAEARQSGRVAGAGLQFIGGDDAFRARLDACIESLLLR
jgi:uncharacterized protein (TIGR02266 family)